nr:hypothetical protein [Pedobacter sp. ASV19]
MNKILGVLACAILAVACAPKPDYKAERDEVMKFHDVVMQDHGVVVNNQMKLDSLLKDLKGLKVSQPSLDTVAARKEMEQLKSSLGSAEDRMNDWMHQFEPDVTGKSNEEAIKYFKDEKVKITRIDSLYKQEIKTSGAYLDKLKKS